MTQRRHRVCPKRAQGWGDGSQCRHKAKCSRDGHEVEGRTAACLHSGTLIRDAVFGTMPSF